MFRHSSETPLSLSDIQAQSLELMKGLQKEFHTAILFITHDLGVVARMCDRVAVMYLGQIVEKAPAVELFRNPRHPYTEALLSAVPVADPKIEIERIQLQGEIPNPANPPSGCYFHERCSYCQQKCAEEVPPLQHIEGRLVACHRAEELHLRGFSYSE